MNERLAAGYDILIWVDGDGDVVCCGYSRDAQDFLRSISANYTNGDILEIISHPDEFFAATPHDFNIGYVSAFGRVVKPLTGTRLQ
jgi:hypothetical protein